MELKRGISTWGILFATVSATIGSGWLFGSLYASKMAGPAAIFAWLIGAVTIIIIALCFAELATLFPVSGGMGLFPLFTHGPLASFLLGWVSWLAFIVIIPIEVMGVLQYGATLYPALMTSHETLTPLGYGVAVILAAILLCINVTSAKIMAKTSFYITIWKLLIPSVLVMLFFYQSHHWENFSVHGFAPYGFEGLFSSLSVGGIILAFNGFQPGVALAGETENPQKNIPLAIIGSMLICMVLYCLLQMAFILALPPQTLANGWSQVSFAGQAGPFAGLAVLIGLAWFGIILYSDALISPFGCGIVFMAASARASYSMSKNGHLPKVFQKLSGQGVPTIGLWVSFCASLLLFFFLDSWQEMAAFYAAAICLCNAVVPVTLFLLRRNFPHLKRPFQIPWYKVVSFVAFYISSMLFYWCGWNTIWKLYVVIAMGFVTFFFLRQKREPLYLISFVWIAFYLIAFGVLSYLGSYGNGRGVVLNGFDFLFMGLICVTSFFLAFKYQIPHHQAQSFIENCVRDLAMTGKNKENQQVA